MTRGFGCLAGRVRQLRTMPISDLIGLFGPWIEGVDLGRTAFRDRLLSPPQTFGLFLNQVLAADKSCRATVRKWLGWLIACRGAMASPNTAAYCKARQRLPQEGLVHLHEALVEKIENSASGRIGWHGRTVKVVDGSSVTLPDTPHNQALYPQPPSQKPGCGFPVMWIVALFSLASGALLALAQDRLAVDERTLFRRLWNCLQPGDVALSDRGFSSFADLCLLQAAGVDSVMRTHQRPRSGSRREFKEISHRNRYKKGLS